MDYNSEFMVAEYQSLRDEQKERLKFLYEHGISILTVCATLLSLNFGLFLGLYNNINTLIESKSYQLYIPLLLIQSIIFLVPLVIILPASSKIKDMLKQIATLGSYFRIFYELPNFQAGKISSSWEIWGMKLNDANMPENKHHKKYNIKFGRMRTFTLEFVIMAIVSLIIYAIYIAYYLILITIEETKPFCIILVISLVLTISSVFVIVIITKNVSVKKWCINQGVMANFMYLIFLNNQELIKKACELDLIDIDTLEQMKKKLELSKTEKK